jgi:AcrR family transcriptional regulator
VRTKSAARRQAILDMAAAVFQEAGFERASIATICKRLGYSKATLYNYFASKEELFSAVVFDATEAEFEATLKALDPSIDDMTEALENFGRRFLALLYSPQVQAVRRLMASEAGRSDLGRKCFELGPARSESEVARVLQEAMAAGKLRRAEPRIAGHHLRGLLESEWFERFLFHTVTELTPLEVAATVHRAVAAFMAAYGPVNQGD